MSRSQRTDVRNIAIIAHVDHGKTTLVDAMLWQSGIFRANEDGDGAGDGLDRPRAREGHHDHGQEHGHPSTKGTRINIVDTPGHADFGGEVERTLKMVDGVLLLVDAAEGPLPQTRFVLRKALEAGLTPIVVINKIDRPDARVSEVVNEVYDLFIDLDATRSSSTSRSSTPTPGRACAAREPDGAGRRRWCRSSRRSSRTVPAPVYDPEMPLQMLDHHPRLRRLRRAPRGRPHLQRHGAARDRRSSLCRLDGARRDRSRSRCSTATTACTRVEIAEAGPGDIVAVAGIDEVSIGETISDRENPRGAAADPGRRADHLHGLLDQRLAVLRPRRQARHLAQAQGAPGEGAPHQRLDPRRGHRDRRGLQGLGPRRAAARDPDRDDAPRGLRAVGRQARGHHPRVDGKLAEPMEHADHRLPRGLHRRASPRRLGRPPRAHDEDDQPRLGPGAHRVPHAVARPDRLPHRVPHRHAGHRHHEHAVRRLGALAGRHRAPRDRRPGRRPRRASVTAYAIEDLQPRGVLFVGAGRRGLRGHDRRRARPRQRPRRQHRQARRSSPTCAPPAPTTPCAWCRRG